MKGIISTVAILIACTVYSYGQTQESKWKLTKSNGSSFEQLWEKDSSHIGATECGEGYLSAPKRENMVVGDSWIWHFPASGLKKGDYFEFDFVLGSMEASPKYFVLEYREGGKWKRQARIKCIGGANEPTPIIQTIRISKPERSGELLVRLRADSNEPCRKGDTDSKKRDSRLKLMPYGYIAGYACNLGSSTPKDTVKIGYLGNSFTFVNAADFILKQLAWCEGHYLDMHVSTYPGARFKSHFTLEQSMDVISEGGYDWFILQDQSTQAARHGRDSTQDILDYTKSISSLIRYFSPDAKILLEQTWAFSKDDFGGFGSFENFDVCSTIGVRRLSKAARAEISPIAQAFAIVREERPDIDIYSTDYHHPAAYGAYLKACVNYLCIFKEPFSSEKANFALDSDTCAYLRSVAQRVVFQQGWLE